MLFEKAIFIMYSDLLKLSVNPQMVNKTEINNKDNTFYMLWKVGDKLYKTKNKLCIISAK